jgi:hypothetical protein
MNPEDDIPSEKRIGVIPLLAIWVFVLSLAGLLVLGVVSAFAHDALPTATKPLGWSYPFSCCSNYDCREAAEGTIQETPAGYRYTVTGDIVAYMGDARLRNSPDGKFHICTVGGYVDGRTLCLFAPPRGM